MASKFDEKVLNRMEELAPLDFGKAESIADEFELKARAVVAAAVRNGIAYNRKARASKTGKPVVSKTDLVVTIAKAIGVEVGALDGLEKANKTALETLLASIRS